MSDLRCTEHRNVYTPESGCVPCMKAEIARLNGEVSDLLMRLKDEWGKKEYEKLQIRCDAAEKRVRDFMCSIEGGWYARYMAQDAEYEKLKEELRQVRVARDAHRDISFYKEEELAAARKELDEARQEGYAQGWKHCKQVQDAVNEASIEISRKTHQALVRIIVVVERENDPDWSKVQKIKGIVLPFTFPGGDVNE